MTRQRTRGLPADGGLSTCVDVCTVAPHRPHAGRTLRVPLRNSGRDWRPGNQGARLPQERLFLCARTSAQASFAAARVGEPSGSPVPWFRHANLALGRHPSLAWGVAVDDRNQGANEMAGTPLGACALAAGAAGTTATRTLTLAPGSTRTRRSHGAFPLGDLVASVYSSRRDHDGRVTLSVGRAALRLDVSMAPQQARAMARALEIAARVAEGQLGGVDQFGGAA